MNLRQKWGSMLREAAEPPVLREVVKYLHTQGNVIHKVGQRIRQVLMSQAPSWNREEVNVNLYHDSYATRPVVHVEVRISFIQDEETADQLDEVMQRDLRFKPGQQRGHGPGDISLVYGVLVPLK